METLLCTTASCSVRLWMTVVSVIVTVISPFVPLFQRQVETLHGASSWWWMVQILTSRIRTAGTRSIWLQPVVILTSSATSSNAIVAQLFDHIVTYTTATVHIGAEETLWTDFLPDSKSTQTHSQQKLISQHPSTRLFLFLQHESMDWLAVYAVQLLHLVFVWKESDDICVLLCKK